MARLKRWKFGARTEAMDAQQRQLFLETLDEDEADLQAREIVWRDAKIEKITFELARPGAGPDAVAKARQHFARAVELSGGNQAGPYVSLAESVALQQQNAAEFKALLDQALAVKVDARPEWRLVNTLMQRRAAWLLGRIDDLILPALPPETPKPK